MDFDYVHDYLVQESVLGHHGPQGWLDYPVFEEFEKGALEEAPPDEVLLPGLPFDLLDRAQHLHVTLENEGQDFEE